MNDNEIIKALGYCISDGRCKYCPYYETSCLNQTRNALDLINRQKAEIENRDKRESFLFRKIHERDSEIERLEADREALINGQTTLQKMYAEAIKKFAERLKQQVITVPLCQYEEYGYKAVHYEIDELVKEMTEGSK
jgi:hypothetical protein